MPGIMPVMDQKDTCVVWFASLSMAPCIWQTLVLCGSCLKSTVRVSALLGFDSGYMSLPVYGFFLVALFPYSAQCLLLSGPRYALVTEFASSISLSWCRGRFPRSCCSADHSNSHLQLLDKVIDGPVVRVVLFFRVVHMPVVCNDRCPVTFRSCSSSTRLSTPCHGTEFDPHGWAYHRDSPVAVHTGDVLSVSVVRVPQLPSC